MAEQKDALGHLDDSVTSDIGNIFDTILKPGYKVKEGVVIPDKLTVKLRPLSYSELAKAEAEISRSNPDIPDSITVKLRAAKILSFAIIAINGDPLDGADAESTRIRRLCLYEKLVAGPTIIVEAAYNLYLHAVKEEQDFYLNPDSSLGKDIESF